MSAAPRLILWSSLVCLSCLLAMPSVIEKATAAEVAAGPGSDASFVQVAEKISAHVHLLRLPATMFLDPTGNVVVIEQSDGLVVVDSGGYYGAGKRVVAMVKSISPKPVKALVLTHYHSDHSFGVPAILEAWPKAQFIAHEGTLKAMAEGRPPGAPRQRSAEFEAVKRKRLSESFAEQAGAAAEASTTEERAGWAGELSTLEQRLADVPGTFTVLPRRTFRDRFDIPDPVTPVELLFLGRANTPGDAIVWLPHERILITGDIVVAPIPYMFSIYPAEMRQVLQRMRALDFTLIIPGHGSPQTLAYLNRLDGLVADVQARVAVLAKRQLTLEKMQEQMDGSDYRAAFAGADQWLGFWFDNYTWGPLVESAYREARGEPLGPTPVKR